MVFSESFVETRHDSHECLLDLFHRGRTFALFDFLSSLQEVRLLGFVDLIFQLFDAGLVYCKKLWSELE